MKVKVLKDVQTMHGRISAGKQVTGVLLKNGDIILKYVTCCDEGTVKLKKGDYEIIKTKV